jgi:hypothetical protein
MGDRRACRFSDLLVVTTHAKVRRPTCTSPIFYHKWLSNHTVIGHRAREAALLKLVHALLDGSKLSLTQLGRHRAGSAYEKDAGFRGPWFKAVEARGWDWVGRIRNKIKYYDTSSGRWRYTDTLYEKATARVQHIGEVSLSPRHGYRFRMYLVRALQAIQRSSTPRRACQVSARTDLSSAAPGALADRDFAAPRGRQLAEDSAAVRSTDADRRNLQRHEVPSLGLWLALCSLQRWSPVGGASVDRGLGFARAVVGRPLRTSSRLVASAPSQY